MSKTLAEANIDGPHRDGHVIASIAELMFPQKFTFDIQKTLLDARRVDFQGWFRC